VQSASANGIPFPREERGRAYSSYVEQWKDWRAARGLDVPDLPPPKCERPDYSRDVGAALPVEMRATRAWSNHDEVVAWVARYLAELESRDRASQRAYDAWARQQTDARWASVLDRHGGWAEVGEEAWSGSVGMRLVKGVRGRGVTLARPFNRMVNVHAAGVRKPDVTHTRRGDRLQYPARGLR
jgi:hypothetical protein